jgi:phosphatidylserine/phosphatidylglycerophosphate/cardiolipin synthase-like enzyme
VLLLALTLTFGCHYGTRTNWRVYRIKMVKNTLQFVSCGISPTFGSDFLASVLPLIEQAHISIDICAYNWAFKDWERCNQITIFTKAVMAAKKRGVIVRAVLNAESATHYITRTNSRTIQKITSVGIEAKLTRTTPITHCKLIIIDNEYTIIGSHNLTARSITSNDETSAIIKSKELAAVYKNYFNAINMRY